MSVNGWRLTQRRRRQTQRQTPPGRGRSAMKKPDRSAAMEKYIAEIDRFATMLSSQQIEITKLMLEQERAKARYDSAKEAVREAKDYEHETVALLLKFITPGSIDILPLFDTMDAPDEEKQGKNSTEWRKEPITSLGGGREQPIV